MSAHSASFQVIQNWMADAPHICVAFHRDRLENWLTETSETSWSSVKGDAKFCICRWTTSGWKPTGWRAGWQKSLGGPCWHQVSQMSQKSTLAVKKATSTLSCIKQSLISRSEEVILALCSALVRQTWSGGSGSGFPQDKGDMDLLEQIHQKTIKVMKGLERLSNEEKLRECSSVQPREEKIQVGSYQWLPDGQK